MMLGMNAKGQSRLYLEIWAFTLNTVVFLITSWYVLHSTRRRCHRSRSKTFANVSSVRVGLPRCTTRLHSTTKQHQYYREHFHNDNTPSGRHIDPSPASHNSRRLLQEGIPQKVRRKILGIPKKNYPIRKTALIFVWDTNLRWFLVHILLTHRHDCCVKIACRAELFIKIWRFKGKSTKNKVNNENVSDVNIDKTTQNAMITDKKG